MCGIAGILDYDRPPTLEDLRPMVDIQRHRGPDSSGCMTDGPAAFGMRRLSIIDVAGGDQPVVSDDGSIQVVFNGEIYNYIELRQGLIERGYRFKTNSDTETLLHLYQEYGLENFLPKLDGMFSFAIWDRRRARLSLARDPLGIKPLYFGQFGARWLFASELKAILTQPEATDLRLDVEALADFLRLIYIPREHSPYEQVRKLLPGHYLQIDPLRHHIGRWFDLAENVGDAVEGFAEQDRGIQENFDNAVRLQMRSDVPVGSFLSGGLDSSLITVSAQRLSQTPIDTFNVGFDQTDFDESPYAREVATMSKSTYNELTASAETGLDALPNLLWHMDEPIGDSSCVPNHLVSSFAASKVKVCLSGLGGDELFGGYQRYVPIPRGRVRRVFELAPSLAGGLAPVIDRWSYGYAEQLRLAASANSEWRDYLHRIEVFNPAQMLALGFPAKGRAQDTIESVWNRCPIDDPVARRQFVDQHTYLPDQILALTDRMSMASSLEVRVPFLSPPLVRFAQRIPAGDKQTGNDFKIGLKRALGDRVPRSLIGRPKWGFDAPLGRWVGMPKMMQAIRTLPRGAAVREGLLDPKAVARWTQSPDAIRRHPRRIWNLLVLDIWLRVRRLPLPPNVSTLELFGAA